MVEASPAPLPARADTAIEVSHVSKRFKLYHNPVLGPLTEHFLFWRDRARIYREFQALNDVSFTVRRGEVVGIIGPNGAGKTTLLKMIAGLLPVQDGSIKLRGKVTALLALGVGVHPEFSGRENIYFSGLLLGMSKAEIAAKEKSIIEFAEIGEFIDQPFRTYSSGMKARLLFAISMSIDPDILIVDEALATGDAGFVRKCEKRIRELCDSGATILFVSHNMTQINSLCDRSVLLVKGRVECIGPPLEVFERYKEKYIDAENRRLAAISASAQLSAAPGAAIRLKQVVFRDASGKESNAFFTGEPMTIELQVERLRPGNRYFAFVGFLMGTQYVGQIDTENLVISGAERSLAIDAQRSIVFEIDQVVMLNGVFSLWVLFLDAETREPLAEYRNVGNFRVAKRHYPFDADSYFAQPIAKLTVD